MVKKICFIGHRSIYKYDELRNRLLNIVEENIKNGCKFFTMGTHGDFDKLALSVCQELRNIYNDIEIEVVITSFREIEPIIQYDLMFGVEKYIPYSDVKTTFYNIEEEHFKRKITFSNQQMIETCDALICFVDIAKRYGGAILAYKYAKKKGLDIFNLY